MRHHATALPTGANPEGVAVLQSRIEQLADQSTRLQKSRTDAPFPLADVPGHADLLARLSAGLGELSDLLTQVYFSHVTPQVN